jgi:hypothetical protein
VAWEASPEKTARVNTHTTYLTFNTEKRQEIIDITEEVEKCRAAAGIKEGMVLVSAMHISASVFVNDHEPGLWKDILDWLEKRIAPWSPDDYRTQQRYGRGQRRGASQIIDRRSRSDRSRDAWETRFRAVAARFLWRVGRSAPQARADQGNGGIASVFWTASSAPMNPMRL